MLKQMMRAARLDRTLYNELFFDSYATGNAVMLVAGVYAVIYLGLLGGGLTSFSVPGFVSVMLGGLIGWLILAGAMWLAGTKIFEGSARGATVIRLTGFAHGPLALLVVAAFIDRPLSQLIIAASLLWLLATLTVAAQVLFDMESRQAAAVAVLAVAGWWVLQRLGIGADLARLVDLF